MIDRVSSSAPILLVAFGPFRGRSVNGSATIVNHLIGSWIADHKIVGAVLPVRWDEPQRRLPELLRHHAPALVLGLGEGEPFSMRFETCALNHAIGADIDGCLPESECISSDGPETYGTSLQFDETWFDQEPLGFRRSSDAGRYLCNSLLYTGLRISSVPFGFAHLPPQQDMPDSVYLSSGVLMHTEELIRRNLPIK